VTFSFSLVLGLLLLAPGLAAFVGLYHGSRLGPVESPPPPPQSILAVSFVTVAALGAHLLGASVFLLQDLLCAGRACIPVSYEPNVYAALFSISAGRGRIAGLEVVAILATLAVLTVLSFALARGIVSLFAGASGLKRLLYGWLGDLVVAETDDEAVLAYVVSDVQDDGTVVGYEGVVGNMTTNAEREITSVLLISCETFYLRVTRAGVVRREALRSAPIEQLYLDRSRIKNVAFERLRFEGGA
jgi:hypothetical protein